VRLSISDTGAGIPPDALPRIFDPFYSRRADGAEGTGLGLTICRAIIERWDGRIEVESTPGEGSTFTITLPRAEARLMGETDRRNRRDRQDSGAAS
jgi:signal transduction histidine kinase